jgi:dTDP-4-dehydrorhamnose reductase
MKLLVLGGDGMLGHQLLRSLAARHEVRVTLRRELAAYREYGLFNASNAYDHVDVTDDARLLDVLAEARPDCLINAVGIVKQRPQASETIPSLKVNSLLPHELALMARCIGARFVHFSTDCVFSGRKGNYSETDLPDPVDLYGRSKLLGEVDAPQCITIRTSIIGHELANRKSLVEWFLAQRGVVRGYTRAIYSGVTTIELARILDMLITDHPQASGIWHVASKPIDKFSLLKLVCRQYGMDTEIVPDADFQCDRSLDASKFSVAFGYTPPSWEQMIAEMHEDRENRR